VAIQCIIDLAIRDASLDRPIPQLADCQVAQIVVRQLRQWEIVVSLFLPLR
jgi:hypothetical protein